MHPGGIVFSKSGMVRTEKRVWKVSKEKSVYQQVNFNEGKRDKWSKL